MKKINNSTGLQQGYKRLLWAASLCLASAGLLRAQTNIASYRLSKTTETYTPITGGTVFISTGVYDNQVSSAITIPSFTFGGVAQTSVYISANGYITFGAAPAAANYTPLSSTSASPSSATINGVVSAYGADLGFSGSNGTTGAANEIRYAQVGNEFVVQYTDMKRWNVANERVSFQIRLNSATGAIKVIYGGTIVPGSSTTGLQVGIRGNSTTWSSNVNNLMIDNVPSGTTCSWADAVTGNSNSSSLYTSSGNSNVAPTAGLTYTWTPATGPAPVRTFSAVSNITPMSAKLSWTAPAGATQYNIEYRVPGACTWTSFPGNPVTADTTATLTGLTQGTAYQVRVQASNGTNNAIWSHIPDNAGSGNGYTATGTFTTVTTCAVPTAVTVPAASINSTTATVNWTAPTIGPPTGYKWEVRTSGAPGSGTTGLAATGTSTGTTANVTNLNSATTYSVYVRTLCGASDSSAWTSAVNFTTMCSTPPASATIASFPGNPCIGTPVALSLATATPGPGVTYQWQSSVDNVTYTNISGATSATYTGSATATYYRCMVRCAAGPDSTASTPVQLNYNNSITGTTPAQRCGIGTVNLAATGSAGSTVRWYSAATGGVPLASGTTFTTPSINTTTTYYAGAESLILDTVRLGNGTSAKSSTSYPNPLSAYYGGTKHQMLFRASELQAQGLAAGNITAIAFDVSAYTASGVCQDFTIRMGTTTATAMSGFVPGTVTVYNATYTPNATGIVTFTLSTPFNWDGTSNIIVETVHNAGNSGNGSGTTTRYTTTPFNSVYARAIDNITPAGVASFDTTTSTAGSTVTSADRPNIIFTGQKICSSPRMPVTATVNTPPAFSITPSQTVCNAGITPLTVTSNTGSFSTYTWSPATGLYTDAAATMPYTAGTSAATVYLKSTTAGSLVYTATANNTTTQCAAAASDTITVLPAAATATATPSYICFSGATTLTLSPASGYGAATFKWQSSTDNINFADEGANSTAATYTTPTLTASRYYRVTIRNSAGALCLNSSSDTALVYIPAITATTPGARCGAGTVTLAATGNTNTTPVWYTAATGGSLVGTGNTFTTPSLSATTSYWVAARVSGSIDTATVGNGTSLTTSTEELTAFCNRRQNYRMQMIFTQAELNAAGIYGGEINSIGFRITDIGDAATNANFVVKMGTTTQNTFSGYINTGMNTVYGPQTYTHAVGLNTIPLSTSFIWDGTSNIVVEVLHDGIDAINNARTYYTTTASAMAGYSYNSATTATTTTKRFNTTFGMRLCESPRQQVTATVNPNPVATVTPGGTIQVCEGSTATLTAGGGGNYQWRNAAGNISGQTGSTLTTGTAGTYRVVVTTPATGCTDTSAAVTINVNPLPVVSLGNDTAFCSGPALTLDAGNTGAAYLWDNASTNQTRSVNATGTYYVKVTDNNNCSKNDTIHVTVNPTPVVNLGNDTNLCQGTNFVLNAGNPGAAHLWDNGSTGQTRTVNATGTYYVKVTNTFSCSAGDTITTTFLPSPVVNLGNDIDICAGNNVILNAGNPGETFLWDNGATTQTRTVSASGTYHVTVTNIANCKGSDTINVVIHPLPVVDLGNDTTFCHGNTLTLNAGNPGAAYLWSDLSTAQTLTVGSTGNYGVVVTDVHNCVGTDNINILVKDPPSGIINAVYGDTATYTFNVLNPQYVTSYTWNFGDGSPAATGPVVQHRYMQNGIYTVSVTLGGECSDSTIQSRTVDVYDGSTGITRVEDSKDLLLYPNPARDMVTVENKNSLKLKHITVYNAIGQVIYNAKAENQDKHRIHTGAMASGMYTIRIETDKGFVIRKFEIVK